MPSQKNDVVQTTISLLTGSSKTTTPRQSPPPAVSYSGHALGQFSKNGAIPVANSLVRIDNPSVSKVQSMILYLPQEHSYSRQLELTLAVLYPDPSTECVFVASDAASRQASTLPKSLSKLPGFSSAPDLLPGYFVLLSAMNPGLGVVEVVMCDIRFKISALSVLLLSGSQTV